MDSNSWEAKFSLAAIYILVFAVPLIILPGTLADIFTTPKALLIQTVVSLLAAIYLIRFFKGNCIYISKSPTTHLLIFLVLLNFITFFYTENVYYSKIAVRMNITFLLFFYFVSIYTNKKTVYRMLLMIAMSGILVSMITYFDYVEYFRQFSWAASKERVTSTIGNANYLGAYLIFPLFALFGLFFFLKGRLRCLCVSLAIIVFGAFLITESRAPWLGFAISFPIFLLMAKKIFAFSLTGYIKSNVQRVLISLIIALILIPCFWFAAPQKFHAIMKPEKIFDASTLKIRIKYWRASLWLISQNPLFGTGLWSFRNQIYEAQAQIAQTDPHFFNNYDRKPRRVHNDFLEVLNDGGLIAALCLMLFYGTIITHGYSLIKNKNIDTEERIIAATAFSSIIGITVTALLFFPFRIYMTLFMTVLMMGIMESIYLRNTDLLAKTKGFKGPFPYSYISLTIVLFVLIFWFGGYRPLKGELAYYKYLRAFSQRDARLTEKHILDAIFWDPESTRYCFYAGEFYKNIKKNNVKASDYLNRAIINFNGDMTKWSVLYTYGLMKLHKGSIFEARNTFKRALYYYPEFTPAKDKLMEIEKLIQENDKICIFLK